jgi:hypothetical protein
VDLFIVTMTAVHSRLVGDSFTAAYNAVFIPLKCEWPAGINFLIHIACEWFSVIKKDSEAAGREITREIICLTQDTTF